MDDNKKEEPAQEAVEDRRDKKIRKMRECLHFFASVIKSGEPWTATCEREYLAALYSE
jgi:hypothetical protein